MDRFWFKVDIQSDEECWEWLGSKQDNYGLFGVDKKVVFSHRYSWSQFNQRDIPEGFVIRHTCDNPSCVNPHHLLLGTQQENVMDMILRNRRVYKTGETHHKAKLTKDQVASIRSSAESSRALALRYGVNKSTVNRVKNKTLWVE